jgi:Protein tyrosine and serine/threonine kinase
VTLIDDVASKVAAKDLFCEVMILLRLPSHENTVNLHGISSIFLETPSHGFLILEYLTDTLPERLDLWRSTTASKSICFLNQDYSFPADVHSCAILLWEICTLERRHSNAMSVEGLLHMSVKGKIRPSLRMISAPFLKKLLKQSWHPKPEIPPSFASVVEMLEQGTHIHYSAGEESLDNA